MQKLVIYNHGKDSIPWGEKPIALAEVAKQHGFTFISPDYQSSNDPDLRVKQLLAMELSAYQEIILVGSSIRTSDLCPQSIFYLELIKDHKKQTDTIIKPKKSSTAY